MMENLFLEQYTVDTFTCVLRGKMVMTIISMTGLLGKKQYFLDENTWEYGSNRINTCDCSNWCQD